MSFACHADGISCRHPGHDEGHPAEPNMHVPRLTGIACALAAPRGLLQRNLQPPLHRQRALDSVPLPPALVSRIETCRVTQSR
jgi:hypothetical protein